MSRRLLWLFGSAAFGLGAVSLFLFDPGKKISTQLTLGQTRQDSVGEMHPRKNAFEGALNREFLSETDWERLLRAEHIDAAVEVLGQKPPEFWTSNPIAPSAAYRVFGRVAQLKPDTAIDRIAHILARDDFTSDAQKSCFCWALIGTFENCKSLRIEDAITKFPRILWPEVIKAATMGSDDGDLSGNLRAVEQVLRPILNPDKLPERKPEFAKLRRTVVEAWIYRDPRAVIAWLHGHTDLGEAYSELLQQEAIAVASTGEPDLMASLLGDPQLSISLTDAATAAYQSDWSNDALKSLLARLPNEKSDEFLSAYAKVLTQGSPRDLIRFVSDADPALLTGEVATLLLPNILQNAPHLYGDLALHVPPQERDRLLDSNFGQLFPITPEASDAYLHLRGAGGPFSGSALETLAAKSLEKALEFVNDTPLEGRAVLEKVCYQGALYRLISTNESTGAIISFLRTTPAQGQSELAEYMVKTLTDRSPQKALQLLDEYETAEPRMWELFFENARLTPDELNNVIGQKLNPDTDPAVYASAASRITEQFAKESIPSACDAVESIPDPGVQAQCTARLVRVWGEADPLDAFNYVTQLAPGDRRDRAIEALLPKLSFAALKREDLLALASSEKARADIISNISQPK